MTTLPRKPISGPLAAARAWSKRIVARRQSKEMRALWRRVEAARFGLGSPARNPEIGLN